jgi:CTD kinase subunit alpha
MDVEMEVNSPIPLTVRVPPSGPSGLSKRSPSPLRNRREDQRASSPDVDQIAAYEREYNVHLASVAPYIKAAFQSWSAESTAPPLPGFLVHYFGRHPTEAELGQIQQLLDIRRRMMRVEREIRMLAPRSGEVREKMERQTSIGVRERPFPAEAEVESAFAEQITDQVQRNGVSEPQASAQATVPPPPPSTVVRTEQIQPAHNQHPVRPGETYERIACVGEGTYGKVYKARNVETNVFVALKRIRMEGEKDGFPITSMREIKLLQGLHQENVMRLIEMMVSKGFFSCPVPVDLLKRAGSVYMVFEYMDHDLTGLLAHPDLRFSPANIKSLNHQMLKGLAYLHHRGILHRDMKGSNILLNARGVLKLADFGLARFYSKRKVQDYTNRVITLWYRSPELLLGETAYGPEVDMWSAG